MGHAEENADATEWLRTNRDARQYIGGFHDGMRFGVSRKKGCCAPIAIALLAVALAIVLSGCSGGSNGGPYDVTCSSGGVVVFSGRVDRYWQWDNLHYVFEMGGTKYDVAGAACVVRKAE